MYWSPSSRTALAEAELEYAELPSPSTHIAFELTLGGALKRRLCVSEAVHAVVWTTTPWTIPANQAIAVNADITYALVRARRPGGSDQGLYVVAQPLLGTVAEAVFDAAPEVVATMAGAELVGSTYRHPLRPAMYEPLGLLVVLRLLSYSFSYCTRSLHFY